MRTAAAAARCAHGTAPHGRVRSSTQSSSQGRSGTRVSVTVGPRWSSDSLAPEERGQYPLGVENAIAFHARNLVPFTTTVTAHPRYYALHARAAAVGTDDEIAAKELLRRLEVLLGAATLLHAQQSPQTHDPADTLSAPHGYRAIGAALLNGPALDLADLAQTYGGNSSGYSGAYRGVEQAYGMSGRQPDVPLGADALSALDPLVELASRNSVSISELEDADLCVCALRGSADGRALRSSFFLADEPGAPEGVRAARRAGRLTAQLCLAALDGQPVTARVTDALADLCCYGDVDDRLAGASQGASASAARWRGALLRNQSVTAWRWLWWWLTAELDRAPSSSEVLTRAFADKLIASAGGRDEVLSEAVWDQLPAGHDAHGLLPAERALREAPDDAYGTSPLVWLRMLAVGVRRLDELDDAALGHFSAGRDDWGPTEAREYLSSLEGKRLSQVAEDLVPKLLRRAQSVARRRQQWTRHGLRMPTRLRPVGDILYVTGPEGKGEAALRQFRLVQMLNSLGVLGVDGGHWEPGPHAEVVA